MAHEAEMWKVGTKNKMRPDKGHNSNALSETQFSLT